MTKPLVTWGVSLGRTRSIVATATKSAAIKALGLSRYHFDMYAADTGNPEEIAIALADPGQVFRLSLGYLGHEASWEKVDGHYA